MPTARTTRIADPYRDLAVIDARAPRLNQLLTGLLALSAVASGAWPLLALAAAQISLGLFLGRRWCLACRIYFALVQPVLGEGPIEDSRPVKFANQVGAGFLGSATLAHLLGWHALGDALGGTVAALALLAATTGFCLRGIRGRTPGHIDLAEVGAAPGRDTVVQFTHPLCGDCQSLASRLTASGRTPVLVDVSRRPELARKYGVAVVPLAVAVRADGSVARQIH
jgi:hypothetical protein